MTRSLLEIRKDSLQMSKLIEHGRATIPNAVRVLCAYIEELSTHIEELKNEQDLQVLKLRQEIVVARRELLNEFRPKKK